MSKPNFFAGIDALNCLLQTDFERPTKDIDLTLDFIELPFWFSFQSDEKTQTLKAYTQMELYSKDERMATEKGSLVLDRASGQASVKAVQEIGENMGAFYAACQKLSCLIQEKDLEPLYADLDPDEAGILLMENSGKLSWKVVSGRERPSLTVQTLFGGTTMGRPYMDDFWERSELDDLSIEEKIKAAEDGNITAMEELAMLYLNGDEDQDIEPDPKKCVYWFQKAAEAGDATAMFNLGLHYAKGHGVERDFTQAVKWMQKAADAGDDDALRLIEEYQKLADAVKKAEMGDAQAQADLAGGLMKLGGSLEQAGPGSDYSESVKWAQKSVDAGCAAGYWPLALAYEHGRGVEKDTAKAIELYKKGAELGNAPCQHSYACYILRGDIKGDTKLALELVQRSADQGYALAYRTLGYQYEQEGDMDKELEYFEKACLADPSDAEFVRHVAFQYENGDGSDAIDLERAIHWFKVAADGGDMLALHEYQRLTAEPPAFQAKADDDKPMPPYEFDLTNTKKGDRKERSNRIKVGDKVTFRINSANDRIDAVTSHGDVGDISTDSWLSKVAKKDIPYSANIIHVVSYDALDNKRKNPTVTVRLKIDATRGEIRQKFGWSFIPDGIYGDGSYGFWGGVSGEDETPLTPHESTGVPAGYMEAMALFDAAEEVGYKEPGPGKVMDIAEPLAFLTEKAKAGDRKVREAIRTYYAGNPNDPSATPETLAMMQAWSDEEAKAAAEEEARRQAEAKAAEAKRKAEAERLKKEEEEKRAAFRTRGVCQYCGGEFKKGFLSTKCTVCGKRKDY